jgi:single-stranded DNA-binding protein
MFIQMQAFGRVDHDPQLRIAENGSPHSEFTLAVETKRCVQGVTIPLHCYAWGEQAKTIQSCITKGSMLFVQGHFSYQPYTTEDGTSAVSLEVNVEQFQLAPVSEAAT